jgi:predicted AAA+ superfamily ATPase
MVVASGQGQNLRLLFDSLLGLLYRDADRYVATDETTAPPRMAQFGRILETVLGTIASHTGSPTQNATLLSTDSPAYRTVLPLVLEALWAWHLAYLVPFEAAQQTTKKGYSSKKYLFDTGVANFLLTRLMPVQLGDGREITAMLLENAVLQDCVSTVESIKAITCYHSSNKVPTELDFVLSLPGRKLPIEVKSSTEVKRQTLSQLMDFLERTTTPEGIVVYTGTPRTEELRGKVLRFIPPYKVIGLLSGG